MQLSPAQYKNLKKRNSFGHASDDGNNWLAALHAKTEELESQALERHASIKSASSDSHQMSATAAYARSTSIGPLLGSPKPRREMSAPLRQLSAAHSFKQDAFKQDTPLAYASSQEREALEAANMASPLKVPLPGPKPRELKSGVRPRAELWNALGGGIAVTLNPYIHAQTSDDSDTESDPGGPRRGKKKEEADGAISKKLEHMACVSVAVWSKDGCSLITGDSHGLAILWDVVSASAVRRMKAPPGGLHGIQTMQWSPDGNQIVCSANLGKVVVWDPSSGAIQHELIGHNTYGAVRTCRYSPDGNVIASGGDFGILIIWDAASGKQHRMVEGHNDHVNSCCWSPDGRRIASGSADNCVRISAVKGNSQPLLLDGHKTWGNGDMNGITCVQWNPKRNTIASAGRDMQVVIHCTETGAVLHRLQGHTYPISSCSWCPQGTRLASCGKDRLVIIWDTEGGAALHQLVGHQLSARACDWDPSGMRLVTAGADGKLLMWDAEAGTAVLELEGLQGHDLSAVDTVAMEGIEDVSFSPDGSIMVSAGGGGEVIIWDAQPDTRQKVLTGHQASVRRCTWSPDGSKVVSGCESGTVIIWDAESSEKLYELKGHSDAVSGCEFSPDSSQVATSSADGKLCIWDAATGRQRHTLSGHHGPVSRCEWSPNGTKILSAGADGKVGIWDAEKGSSMHMMRQHQGAVPYCSWSPDGRLALSCGWYDRTVLLWDARSGKVVHQLIGHAGAVTICKWSPDGSQVVSGGSRGEVMVWSAETGARILLLRGDHDAPEGCNFSPNGRMVFCYDSAKITVWSLEEENSTKNTGAHAKGSAGKLLLQLQGHHAALSKCAWSPNSSCILSSGQDKRVVVWSIPSGEPLFHLDGHQAPVGCAAWSPCGTAIVSGDEQARLLIWRALPRYSYMAAPGPALFYFRIQLMHGAFQHDLANATATAHPTVLTAATAEGTTLLHVAAQYTDLELLTWMLEFAAQHSFPLGMSQDREGLSPLDYAVQNQWWQGMSKIVGAVHKGVVRLSASLLASLFVTPAFQTLLKHFASELEPLLMEGSACGVTSVANGFTVRDGSGILLKLGQEGIGMVVAGSTHRLVPAAQMQAFWQDALIQRAKQKRSRWRLSQDSLEKIDATAVVRLQRVGWAGCAAAAPSGILHCMLRAEVSAHMFGLPVVRTVIDLKWWSFARKYVMRELALYTVLLGLFTAYALALSETSGADTQELHATNEVANTAGSCPWTATFSEVFIGAMGVSVLALICRFLTHELRQMQMYGRQHWSSFWNWMNAVAFSLYVPVVLMHACGMRDAGAFKVVLAVDAVLLWANLLHFAKAFRGTGALVQMVTMTVSDMRWFVLLLFVVMFGFGTSFLVLFSGMQQQSPDFADVDDALLSMFLFMLGSFNMDTFDSAAVPSAAVLLFVFYEVVVTIVLLNLLIAIMGDSFSKVVENEEQQFLKGRAELIDEVEVAVLARSQLHSNPAWFPRYLHVLRPGQSTKDEGPGDPWAPALARTEERIAAMLENLHAGLHSQLQDAVAGTVAGELTRFLEQPIGALEEAPPLIEHVKGQQPNGHIGRPRLEALQLQSYG